MSARTVREGGGVAGKAMLLFALWGVAAMFMALFWVRHSDLTAAREEALRGDSTSPASAPPMVPEVFRQNFEFRLPVPGEKGKYEWKVQGQKSVSVDANTDEISQFKGEMYDRGDLIRLSSPIVLFDKEKRVISSRHGALLEAPWARIEGREMVMDMKTSDTKFSGDVTTKIDREAAQEREESSKPASAEKGDSEKATGEGRKEEKKKTTPLVITSDELRMYSKKNLAIFIGNVVAEDETGVIVADRMEAYNYTEEEKKKDPKLKGVKTVICTGDVKIDQMGKKQARCAKAVYDAKTNIVHLYHDPKTGKKVVYRQDDEEQKWQAEAQEMILYRDSNEVKFLGKVRTVDFNPDRKGFLGFMEPDRSKTEKEKSDSEPEKQPEDAAE